MAHIADIGLFTEPSVFEKMKSALIHQFRKFIQHSKKGEQ
jgi:hypothetical protein